MYVLSAYGFLRFCTYAKLTCPSLPSHVVDYVDFRGIVCEQTHKLILTEIQSLKNYTMPSHLFMVESTFYSSVLVAVWILYY